MFVSNFANCNENLRCTVQFVILHPSNADVIPSGNIFPQIACMCDLPASSLPAHIRSSLQSNPNHHTVKTQSFPHHVISTRSSSSSIRQVSCDPPCMHIFLTLFCWFSLVNEYVVTAAIGEHMTRLHNSADRQSLETALLAYDTLLTLSDEVQYIWLKRLKLGTVLPLLTGSIPDVALFSYWRSWVSFWTFLF